MHYIYIHRYTINYNKVREAHLISPRFHFHLSIRYSLSFKYGLVNFLACFCNTCYNTELGGLFFPFLLTKHVKVETLSVLLATQGDYQQTTSDAVGDTEREEMKDRKSEVWEEEQVHYSSPGHSLTQGERTDGAYNRWMAEALWSCLKVLH